MASSTVAAEFRKQRQHVIREIHRWIPGNLTNLNRNIELPSSTSHTKGNLTIAETGHHASFRSRNGRIARLDAGQMRHIKLATVFTHTGNQELLNPIGSAKLNDRRLDMDVMEPQQFIRRNPMDYENAKPTQDGQSRGELIEE